MNVKFGDLFKILSTERSSNKSIDQTLQTQLMLVVWYVSTYVARMWIPSQQNICQNKKIMM